MGKARLWECEFLIPIRRDVEISDGELHTPDAWDWLEDELMTAFDGWHVLSEPGRGAWRSGAGKVNLDLSYRYTAAITKRQLGDLRAILRAACVRFAQQCIYLSVAGAVEFVEA